MNILKSTWKQFINSKKFILLSAILDFTFFILIAKTMQDILTKVSTNLASINSAIQSEFTNVQQIGEFSLLTNQEFMANYRVLIKYTLLFFVIFFLLWVFFQGTNWYLAKPKKEGYVKFMKSFALINIFWL